MRPLPRVYARESAHDAAQSRHTAAPVGRAATAKAKRDNKTIGDRMRRRRLLTEAKAEAAEFAKGLRRGVDPADAIQLILDNVMSSYEYATEKVFTLEEEEYWRETLGGRVPHEWIREQERLAMQAVHIAGKAAGMGLAERMVRIQEAQAAIFGQAVEAALVALGISSGDRQKAHEMIAQRLDTIEGSAEELPVKSSAT